jgi:hypothetical protein
MAIIGASTAITLPTWTCDDGKRLACATRSDPKRHRSMPASSESAPSRSVFTLTVPPSPLGRLHKHLNLLNVLLVLVLANANLIAKRGFSDPREKQAILIREDLGLFPVSTSAAPGRAVLGGGAGAEY